MSFAPNPLSLTVSDAAFESWLRDSGHLYTLDTLSSSSSSAPPPPNNNNPTTIPQAPFSFLSSIRTFSTLLAINPLAKLEAKDLASPLPSWTREFIGGPGDYSWPAEASQARMRVQENVRRYAKNYMVLSLIFFSCCLYRMPMSLLGLLACLGIWEFVRFCNKNWEMEIKYPVLRQCMVLSCQIITAALLYMCNIQFALVYSIGLSYSVMLLHASLRKLTPSYQSSGTNRQKKFQHRRVQVPSK
ncbi:hypothetical protein LUZ60_008751 [Juncus effusus]|nr:hypothetical protein LUZ60_008751 [Juncus effusus]